MAKSINIANSKKNNGLIRIAVERLQKSLLRGKKSTSDEAKKGHFVVVAVDDNGDFKRYTVPLNFLSHNSFLRLLDEAAEEYGFYHDGSVLTVPCGAAELERILLSDSKTSLKSC